MSWTLDVFSPNSQQITSSEIEQWVGHYLLPGLQKPAISSDSTFPGDVWQELTLCDAAGEIALAKVQATSFDTEVAADPQLLESLQQDIADSSPEENAGDEEYVSRLQHSLREVRWHYAISVMENDQPEQEMAVVRATHAISQAGRGIVHDLQSGAWMDAELFEGLLDVYGVNGAV